jgi:hypothetical protein
MMNFFINIFFMINESNYFNKFYNYLENIYNIFIYILLNKMNNRILLNFLFIFTKKTLNNSLYK